MNDIHPKNEMEIMRDKIRLLAWNFTWISILVFVVGLIVVFVTAYNVISGDGAGFGFVAAGSLICLALWLFLIAQIIYIRANTEK